MMHSPGIQYCNTFCIRARIIVDGRSPAIETLPGLYLNKLVGRYEYRLHAALCSTGGRTSRVPRKGCAERRYLPVIVGSESPVIALDDEANRCKPDSSLSD